MFDVRCIAGFDWDDRNSRKSAEKHGVSQAEAEQVFFQEPLVVAEDVMHGQFGPRYHALGATEGGRMLHVSFTLRAEGTKIRVISARDMHRKERIRYEQHH